MTTPARIALLRAAIDAHTKIIDKAATPPAVRAQAVTARDELQRVLNDILEKIARI